MKLPKEIYIVICEYDGGNDGIPIAMETYLDERCSKDEADHRAALMGCRYGEVKIGRLIFENNQEDIIDLSDAMTDEEIERSKCF